MQTDDSIIARIRDARREISQEQNHDPRKLIAHYIELQKKYSPRLLESPSVEDEAVPTGKI